MRPPLRSAALPLLVAVALCACDDEGPLNATYQLCLEPGTLLFGDVAVRDEAARTLSVTNCGNVPVDLLLAEIVHEGESSPFRIGRTEVPTPMAPGARFFLPVHFAPRALGSFTARVSFAVPEAGGSELTSAALAGNGVPLPNCDVELDPDPRAFDDVEVGSFAEETLTVTNVGSEECALSGARVTTGQPEFTVEEAPAATLAPAASTTMRVRFTPAAVGARSGTLALVLGGEREVGAALVGEGLPAERCRLALTPSPLALPRASVGYSSSSAVASLASVGELACTIAAVAIAPDDEGFTVEGAPAAGAVLAPAGSDELTVRFTPSAVGAASAELVVTTEEGSELVAPLSAFADPTPTCSLAFSPRPVTFAPLAVGLYVEETVTVQNASDLSCTFTLSLSDDSAPDFTITTPPPVLALDPAQATSFTVRFAPSAAAPALGEARFSLDNGTGAQTLPLVGFGDHAELVLTPSLVPFGVITTGCASRPQDVTVTNVGAVAARLDDVAFTLETDPNFEITSALPLGTLDAGAGVAVTLRMLGAAAPGTHAGKLVALATGVAEPPRRPHLSGRTASLDEAQRTDVFVQRERPAVDILFVVDNSGSMAGEQQNLAVNFDRFIQFTVGLDIDYHIGIVTTDTSGAGAGELVAPYIANVGANASADPEGEFVLAVNVGTDGDASERGLYASVMALTEPLASTANAGFLRDDALLSVIYVSDENDQSPGDVGDYIDRLLAVKGYDENALIASAIAGDVPTGCNQNGNSADNGDRYLDVVNGLGGVFASICTSDWASTMEALGVETFAALTRFELSRIPEESTIEVYVDGELIAQDELNGWTFNPETNAITFHGTSVPEAGETIEVSYEAECLAP